jgi:hypothetical protein
MKARARSPVIRYCRQADGEEGHPGDLALTLLHFSGGARGMQLPEILEPN